MVQRLFFFILIIVSVCGCSSPEPSDYFLRSNMRIITDAKPDGEILRMKPIDLYKVFDVNVKKKWKKNHENSWTLIIKGKDPAIKMETNIAITLTMIPQLDYDVVILKLEMNDKEYHYTEIEQMIRQLDEDYAP